jgi:ParE toxin of type II toxin-antitoxin system, parDE
LSKLDAKFVKIAQFPNLGRKRDEILPGIRSLSVDSYLILYMPIGQDVEIFRVISGYRDLTALFSDSILDAYLKIIVIAKVKRKFCTKFGRFIECDHITLPRSIAPMKL